MTELPPSAPLGAVKPLLVGEIKAAEAALRAPDGVQAIHQTRLALKRVRTIARIVALAGEGAGATLNAAARDAMGELAGARDIAAMQAAARKGGDAPGLAQVLAGLDAARAEAERFGVTKAKRALAKLGRAARAMPEVEIADGESVLARLEARAAKAAKAARGRLSPALRHAWRKRERDRHDAEALFAAAGDPARARASLKLINALGRERDVLLLMHHLSAHPDAAGGKRAAKRALETLAERRERLAARADQLARRLRKLIRGRPAGAAAPAAAPEEIAPEAGNL